MSEGRVPPPGFNTKSYERPNKLWVCGRTGEGCPCRVGPSPSGSCRATTECQPELVVRPNEDKGTWKCTRPTEWGGACPEGPSPEGQCCRTIPKCQPVRSLRGRRGLVTRAAVAAAVGVILIGLSGSTREAFINPGPISRQHRGPEFARLALKQGGGEGCVLCHSEAAAGLGPLADSALKAAVASRPFTHLVSAEPKDFSRMDHACEACHRAQTFHQANVARETSCSVCHREHRGENGLMPVAADHCIACHGDEHQMTTAAAKGRALPPESFVRNLSPGVVVHSAARPSDGYTRLIHGFAADHPEFQALRPGSRDTNPLKFNHRLHLTGAEIPPVKGQRLECAYCHQPDTSGAFMQRITFEKNCRACHALNFDENLPEMTLPHGDPALARAYLLTLPTHYGDLATSRYGLTSKKDIQAFVEQKMRSLRLRTQSGENLERAIFFADGSTGDAPIIAGLKGPARAKFAGCSLCHEVRPHGDGTPSVTTPQTPDRWMLHARFDHSRHVAMKCTQCHAAAESTAASDIILPKQKSCVECHGPEGHARYECSTCHDYHHEPPSAPTKAEVSASPE